MNSVGYEITLDINESQSSITLPVKVGDKNRKVIVSLTEGTEPYVLEPGTLACVEATKNGKVFLGCFAVIENKIICDLAEVVAEDSGAYISLLSTDGVADCAIKTTYSKDGKVTSVASARFTVIIDPRVIGSNEEIKYTEFPYESFAEIVSEYITSEKNREEAESTRQTTFDENEAERQTTFETNESTRQETFDTNEAQRQAEFKANEAARHIIIDHRNLLDGIDLVDGVLNTSGDGVDVSSGYMTSDFIPVNPDSTYTIGCGVGRVGYYDENKTILTIPNWNGDPVPHVEWKEKTYHLKITTPENTSYVRIGVASAVADTSYRWMVEGSFDTTPENMGCVFINGLLVDGSDIKPTTIKNEQIGFSSVDFDKLSFVEGNKDYLDGVTYEVGKTMNVYGVVQDSTNIVLTDEIILEQGETYIVEKPLGASFSVVGFGLDGFVYNHTTSDIVVSSDNTFTIPEGCCYVRCAIQAEHREATHIYKASAKDTSAGTFQMPKLRVTQNNMLIDKIINEGRIVSKPNEEKVAHASYIVSDNLNDYICYYASATATGEWIQNDFAVKLTRQSRFDKCDKETVVVLRRGEKVGDFTQSATISPYDPNLFIVGNNIRVWMIVCDNTATDTKIGYRDVSVNGLGDSVTICKLKYSANGTEYLVDLSASEFALFEDRVRGNTEGTHTISNYQLFNNIREINGKLYTIMTVSSTTDSVAAILSSSDNGKVWEVVKVLDSSFDALHPSEAGWDVVDNTLYIALRCDATSVKYVPLLTYNIETDETSETVMLNNGIVDKSRVWVTCSDGNVYVCSNILPNYKEAGRSRVRITKLNETLEELNYVDIVNPCGCSYFSLIERGGRFTMLYTEDYRMQIALCKGDIAMSDVTQYIIGLDV